MPLHWVSAALLLFIPTALKAQPAQRAGSKHCLWKIEGKRNSVFLLGSVHVLRKEDYPLAASIETAFKAAPTVAFETDIDAMEKPEVMMKMATESMLPPGQTLQEQLSPAVYKSFTNHLQKTGMPAAMFDSFKPAMAAIALVALELKKMDLDPEQGLDKRLFAQARQSGKKIIPLETVDFQIGLLTQFTREEEELMMKTTLKEIETLQTEINQLLAAWKNGDAAKLEKLLNEAMEEAPALYKRLLLDRNKTWVPKIEEWAKGDQNVMVIVGAGHLVGTNGVVELMKKKGYKVSQE